jgi:hypothetical protein
MTKLTIVNGDPGFVAGCLYAQYAHNANLPVCGPNRDLIRRLKYRHSSQVCVKAVAKRYPQAPQAPQTKAGHFLYGIVCRSLSDRINS